jgi:hypothetical protein
VSCTALSSTAAVTPGSCWARDTPKRLMNCSRRLHTYSCGWGVGVVGGGACNVFSMKQGSAECGVKSCETYSTCTMACWIKWRAMCRVCAYPACRPLRGTSPVVCLLLQLLHSGCSTPKQPPLPIADTLFGMLLCHSGLACNAERRPKSGALLPPSGWLLLYMCEHAPGTVLAWYAMTHNPSVHINQAVCP